MFHMTFDYFGVQITNKTLGTGGGRGEIKRNEKELTKAYELGISLQINITQNQLEYLICTLDYVSNILSYSFECSIKNLNCTLIVHNPRSEVPEQ